MVSNEFRTVAKALQPYISDTYDLLNATDAVLRVMEPSATRNWAHNSLVFHAMSSAAVLTHLSEGQKFLAIKELRTLTKCGLKESKEAVEDSRTQQAAEDFRKAALETLREKLTGK